MAKRVLMGNRATGGYGFYVSKTGSDVTSCDREELLFDSSQGRAGEIYAGGNQSTLPAAGQNFLTTGTKPNLGYIPLVIHAEDITGEWEEGWETGYGHSYYTTEAGMLETTSSTIKAVKMYVGTNDDEYAGEDGVADGRRSGQACTNIKWLVLKLPCAYGYMTSTYF